MVVHIVLVDLVYDALLELSARERLFLKFKAKIEMSNVDKNI